MLSSKQRSKLKSIAAKSQAIIQVGKGGISDNLIEAVNDALYAREIVKISVLNNSAEEASELAGQIEALTGAECVHVIGSKIVLYKISDKKGVEHIL